MEAKTYAAIDIGSNGARLLIKRFDDNAPEFDRIKRVLFIRVPLRLGKDVFTLGKISKEREVMMMHMMKSFKHFMLLNQVDDYRACATAAMRDAENGKKIMKTIMQETGIKLEIIRGEEEARLLCNNVIEQTNSNSGSYAYVDVGGGSTEISLLHDGVLAESHSFNIGTLRMLSGKVTNATKYQMRGMLDTYAEEFPGVQIIGSGGNINKLFKLTHNKNDEKVMKVSELREIYQELAQLNEEERKEKYGLKDDRVDVIIPAAEIFLMVASGLKCDAIYVPNISLADSIVDGMYRSQLKKQG
ncbi:MAG: Ppx/GppA family phosphatase [Prevotella bivia]|nr:Ppx/GppA family phosphatase [Prevotella bivia]